MPHINWRMLLPELVVNLLLPWLVFDSCVAGWGERGALLWSALPPTLWSLWELYRHRKLDAMSLLVLGGIALSLLAMLGDGDSRWLLVRESLVTGAIGLLFLLTLLTRTPLVQRLALAAAARQSASERQHLQARLSQPLLARVMRQMTLLWGSGLLAECASRIWLAFHWPVASVVAIGPWLSYSVMGLMAGITWRWRQKLRARAAAASAP